MHKSGSLRACSRGIAAAGELLSQVDGTQLGGKETGLLCHAVSEFLLN